MKKILVIALTVFSFYACKKEELEVETFELTPVDTVLIVQPLPIDTPVNVVGCYYPINDSI